VSSALENLLPTRFIQIDEEGYFHMDGLRVADAVAGRSWLSSVTVDRRGRYWLYMGAEPIFVEAFDEPYVALDIARSGQGWIVTMPYGHTEPFPLQSLSLDEWDRFHGRTERGIPFVLSRSAQARFFNDVDDYDDDGVLVDGIRIATRPWLSENAEANQPDWWSHIYRTEEPRWDLGGPTPVLAQVLPQLKLQRSRILVLGAGRGHDAAWFAEQGHIVTAVDFSEEAIKAARAQYSHLSQLTFVQADVFQLPTSMNGAFDIVFEHTLYCAISPNRRADLARVWRRVLSENGHLLGIFETRDKVSGPPFGGNEWEVRARLQKGFRPLYWMRLRVSAERRSGQEFLVYSQRLATF
jgi:Thiopurine S-methyltransferase (TPMT)